MIYLIRYNRPEGRVIEMTAYQPGEREAAENARLEIELSLILQGIENEVVILEAESEAALRLTHLRYFEGPRAIASSSGEDVE